VNRTRGCVGLTTCGLVGTAGRVDHQQVLDQPLHVDALDEEARRSRSLHRVGRCAPRLHRQPENLDVRELGPNALRRFEAVHVRHRDIHEDGVRPQGVRVRDRLEAVGRLADDRELRALVENFAERSAHPRRDRRR
jgi:hypothetical protein